MSVSPRRPGKQQYDCLAKLEPDEPCFVLIARDRASPAVIKVWATLWLQEISLGLRSETDRAQVTQALKIATEMEIWERDRRQRRDHLTTEFGPPNPSDGSRVPLTGQHRKLDKNTTSGANDRG